MTKKELEQIQEKLLKDFNEDMQKVADKLNESPENNSTHFATFGSGQLKHLFINPIKVMAVMPNATEGELRQRLQEKPFNNKYCTTYPISYADEMIENYGMKFYTIDELI